MTMQTIQLLMVEGKEIRQELSLNKGSKGTTPKIKATPDAKFILADKESGLAPEHITVRRVGKNLHVFLEGEELDHPTVIIEDFFEYNCELIGMTEGGGYYSYVSSDGDDVAGALALQDGESSSLALGGEMLPGDVDRTAFGLMPWLVGGGLAAGAGAGALGSGGGGSKGGSSPAPTPNEKPGAPVIGRITDTVGVKQGDLTIGDITDDQSPTLSGTAAANSKVEVFDNGILIGSTISDVNGNWSFTPRLPLAEGPHSFTARTISSAGQVSENSAVWNILVDITAPSKPGTDGQGPGLHEIGGSDGPIEKGGTTGDNTPSFKGEGTPGDTIIIIDEKNGEVIGETKVDENGKWEVVPNPPLTDGEHEIVVIIQDPAGNESEKSDPIVIIIDTQVPGAPVICQITDNVGVNQGELTVGDITDDQHPTLVGTAKANALVEIFDNGIKIGETRADPKGNWSFTPDQPLSEGTHSFTTRATNLAGISELSPAWPITVDITAPGKPGIDGQGPGLHEIDGSNGPIEQGGITNDNKPAFKGEGTPGDNIIIRDEKNGDVIGETKVDENGNWELTPHPPLKDGEHEIVVIIQDPAGNQSEKSDPIIIVIDTQTPAAPVIASIIDTVGTRQGELTADDVTDDPQPTFSGTAKSKALVEIFDNGVKLGETRADEHGNWSFAPVQALGDGMHSFTARATDLAGNISAQSPAWAIEVDTTAPDQPGINGQGAGISEIIDDFGSVTGPIAKGGVTDDNTPTLNGHGGPGDTIIIFDNNQKIGEANVGNDGTWTFTPGSSLNDGDHAITVIVQDRAGNQSLPSPPWNITIKTSQPAYTWYLHDNFGNEQGVLNNGDVTDDPTPGIWGFAPQGTIIHIYVGDSLIGTAIPNEQRSNVWEFFPPQALADGPHTFTVTFTDPSGVTSPKTSKTITIDTSIVIPTIESIVDGIGVKQGTLTAGAVTDDQQPTLSGKAEAKAVVEILDKGTKIGETRADANGNWSFTPEQPLAEGSHSFTTRATDPAGNVSAHSPAWNIVIDITAPDKPGTGGQGVGINEIIDDVGNIQGPIANGGVTDDSTPTLKGHGTPGDSIIIMDNNQQIGDVVVGADGRWEFTPDNALASGEHVISVIIQDPAGNASKPSDPWVVYVDTDNVPKQVARLSHMGKDSGQDSNDFVTDNGSYGRLMYGSLSAELSAGQTLMVSTDGGKSWFEAMVNGTSWVAQDLAMHDSDWSIQTRIKGVDGTFGAIMEQTVVLDTAASQAPSSIQLNGTNLSVAFDSSNVAEGQRIAVIADGGAHRFEHTLTAQDIAAGSVTLDVGNISSASAALVDLAGNLSDYVNSASRPKANSVLTGDVAEVYGTNFDNVFSISDVSVLQNIRLIEGNDGVDSLKLNGANQVLDFSAWQGRLSSIEIIDITGSGNNTVRISLGDVLELGHHNYFMDEDTVQLAIRGDAGDTVEISDLLPNGMDVGDWEAAGSVTVAGYQYEVYRHTELSADLLVQHGVQVQF